MYVKSHEHNPAIKHAYTLKQYLVLTGKVIFKIRIVPVMLKNKIKKALQNFFIIERERKREKNKQEQGNKEKKGKIKSLLFVPRKNISQVRV